MLLRQGRAERSDRAVEAVLVERNCVHVALGQDDSSLLALSGNIEGEKIFSFVENQRLRGIQVFGRRIVHHAPAEADDVAADIDDRKHEPVAEAVIHAAVFARDRKPGFQHFLAGVASGAHCIQKRRPLVGRKPEPEARDGRLAQAALYDIRPRLLAARLQQLLVEKPRRVLAERPQPLLLLILRLILLVLRHLQPRALCQKPHRVRVAQRLDLHDEVDRAAALVAAEAVVNSLVRRDGKRRRLFRMKRAQPKQV